MATTYDVGDLARITAEFTSSAGIAIDPTALYCVHTDPSGNATTLTYGVDAALVKDDVGKYHVDISVDEAGTWLYNWYSTGTGQAKEYGHFIALAAGAVSAAYTLEKARDDLKRIVPWLTREIDMEPLEGLFDGTNPIFHLPVTPLSPAPSPTFYNAAGTELDGATVISYDNGAVRFSSGSVPSSTVYASYVAQSMSDSKVLDLCSAGFDEMESRYRRGWYIIASGYHYISSTSPAITDPVCGSVTFATSRAQVDFLLACCEYKLVKALATEVALNAYSYREERLGGLMVDRSRQGNVFDNMLKELDAAIEVKRTAAMEQEGNTAEFGEFIPGAQSDTYADSLEWWSTSEQATGV
jgi:hypothetical protein